MLDVAMRALFIVGPTRGHVVERSLEREGRLKITRVSTLREGVRMAAAPWDLVLIASQLPDGTDYLHDVMAVVAKTTAPVIGIVTRDESDRARRAVMGGLATWVCEDDPAHVILRTVIGTMKHVNGESVVPQPAQASVTLEGLSRKLDEIAQSMKAPEADVDAYERHVGLVQRWGPIAGVVSVIFSLGVGYALWLGENATKNDVDQAIRNFAVEHNGGIDPTERAADGKPYGHHPDIREKIEKTAEVVEDVKATLKSMESTNARLDKRSRYQFERDRWEQRKNECRIARNCTREDLRMPPELERLERELINE